MPTLQEIKKRQQYITKANQTEEKYGLPKNLLVGVMGAESNFNPNAVSPVGAKGLMQFMKATAQEYGINPLNPSESIDAAGKYLARSYKKFGNWEDSLRSYNMGVGGLQKVKAGKIKMPKETQDYVGRVYKNAGIKLTPEDMPYYGASYANSVAPYMNQPTQTINYLQIPEQSTNFASVPENTPQKEEKEEVDVETEKVEKESNFLKELENLQKQDYSYLEPQQKQPQQALPQVDFMQQYEQVSQFIDNPQVAQQGGQYTDNEISFLSEIAIKDSNGYWNPNNQGKVVEIDSPNITMKGVSQKLIGISKQTGEKKIMKPNRNYNFADTKQVIEVPLFKK